MQELSFFQWLGGIGGVGAVFGFLMYLALRDSVKTMRIDRKFMEDRLSSVIDGYNKATLENTKILAELYTWLRAKNGNH